MVLISRFSNYSLSIFRSFILGKKEILTIYFIWFNAQMKPWFLNFIVQVVKPIHVTGGRFDRTGPLACLSPFPICCWICVFRSEVLNSNSLFEIKVPNKSLSHELNNHCYLRMKYLRNWWHTYSFLFLFVSPLQRLRTLSYLAWVWFSHLKKYPVSPRN